MLAEELAALGQAEPILRLTAALRELEGIGPTREQAYGAMGLQTVGDLLRYVPRSWRRFPAPTPLAELLPGESQAIRATVLRCWPGRRRSPTRVLLADASGELEAVAFGPAWRAQQFPVGGEVLALVERQDRAGRPSCRLRELWPDEQLPDPERAALVPVYRLDARVPARRHRRWVREALDRAGPELDRRVPRALQGEPGAPSLGELLRRLHAPRSEDELEQARACLRLDEAVRWQIAVLRLRRGRNDRRSGYGDLGIVRERLRAALPFALGDDQERAIAEIAGDLEAPKTMARLLSGDVGSGKTVVSWFPLVAAALAGRQGVLLAPTELLARQHHAGLCEACVQLGLPAPPLLSGRGRVDDEALADPRRVPIAVGTHRLVGAKARFADLASVVVDEQHKFGVRHRVQLWAKGRTPDLLTVSATPIPRTLAQFLLGFLDHSRLGPRPGAARRVRTELCLGPDRTRLAERVRQEVGAGGRVFVVCPAVGEAGVRGSTLPAAEEVGPWFRARLGAEVEVRVLHGRQSSEEKSEHLDAFREGRCRVLVSTVVIEVGVDVPDATMAVILASERFGLAQLHQIRGRVGRRGQEARCVLVSGKPGPDARARLESFCTLEDGEQLAELDLELRGPGEVLGRRQHGAGRWAFPEAMLDPQLQQRARELAEHLELRHKSSGDKDFRSGGVAG